MRGCTVSRHRPRHSHCLFPAHAGMHRRPGNHEEKHAAVPRACGDAPSCTIAPSALFSCSPRMRGCTVGLQRRQIRPDLFPAHAGMHRPARRSARRWAAVPRACGDAPTMKPASELTRDCSPRMRGCTAPGGADPADGALFPAHAGMHRRRAAAVRPRRAVPRACGDAPPYSIRTQEIEGCSPRMRGCTGRVRVHHPFVQLFPAHAGMHRTSSAPRRSAATVPRACGDAP